MENSHNIDDLLKEKNEVEKSLKRRLELWEDALQEAKQWKRGDFEILILESHALKTRELQKSQREWNAMIEESGGGLLGTESCAGRTAGRGGILGLEGSITKSSGIGADSIPGKAPSRTRKARALGGSHVQESSAGATSDGTSVPASVKRTWSGPGPSIGLATSGRVDKGTGEAASLVAGKSCEEAGQAASIMVRWSTTSSVRRASLVLGDGNSSKKSLTIAGGEGD